MELLIDSHVLIWLTLEPDRLSRRVRDLLSDEQNTWLLSIVSIWEIQIKLQLGELSLNLPLSRLIADLQAANNLELLTIALSHIWALEELPNYHRDPFDRLLIAQANAEQLPFLSKDEVFDRYSIQRIW